jgi:hypothetical protein
MSQTAGSEFLVSHRTRRTVAGLAATAAVVLALASVHAPSDSSPPKATRPLRKAAPSARARRETASLAPDVAARLFVRSYVSFLYGGRAGTGVSPIGHGLFEELSDARSTATPAELARAVVVRDLMVSPATRGAAVGSAVVDDGASPPYALSFNLTFSHRRWLVTAAQRDGR